MKLQYTTDFLANNYFASISWPQHIGDLIFPWPSGHSDTCTVSPSSVVIVPCTNSLPHVPQVIVPTLIPHTLQVYNAISISLFIKGFYELNALNLIIYVFIVDENIHNYRVKFVQID